MELKVTKENFIGGNSFFVLKEQIGSTLIFKTKTGLGAIDIFSLLAWESTEFYFEDAKSYFKTDDLREALLVLMGTCMYDDADRKITSVTKYNIKECLLDDVRYFAGIYIVDHPSNSIFEAYLGNNDSCHKLSIHYEVNGRTRRSLVAKLEPLYIISGKVRTPMKLPIIITDMVETGISITRIMNSEVVISKMIDSILQ